MPVMLPRAMPAMVLILASCHPLPAPTPLSVEGAKCRVKSSELRPLIVEWSGMDRTDLEASMKAGQLLVKYDGCDLEVLRECHVPDSSYRWVKTTREDETVRMDDVDQLYAKMPLGGPALEAEFSRGNALTLQTSVLGKYVGTKERVRRADVPPKLAFCGRATHAVIGVTAGAFELATRSAVSLGANAQVAGAKTETSRQKLRKGGLLRACENASTDSPPQDCGALLRLELAPLVCDEGFVLGEKGGCVDAAVVHSTETFAGDAREHRLVAFIRGAGRALVERYQDKPVDPKWQCLAESDIRDKVRDDKNLSSKVGKNVDVAFSMLRFSLVAKTETGKVELETAGFVFGDGRLKWGAMRPKTENTADFDSAIPIDGMVELNLGLGRYLDSVRECKVSTIGASDFREFPLARSFQATVLDQLSKDAAAFPQWCKDMPKITSEWRVVVQSAASGIVGNDAFAVLGAPVDRQGTNLCLRPVRMSKK